MLIRCFAIFLLCCTACRSGIIPCPEVKGLRLKKSPISKRMRFDRNLYREEPEPAITVASDAKTPQASARKTKYRYVKYTMQHIDVEDLDCPRPGEKKVMPRAVKENIRKNRRKVRYYYSDVNTDSLALLPTTYPQR
jgi:hypothetical protein